MNAVDGAIEVHSFLTLTLAILVLFLGKSLNSRLRLLREFTIPEPVSGGLLVAMLITLLHFAFGFCDQLRHAGP
jgi:ESS family glutamate:Na+ symporter